MRLLFITLLAAGISTAVAGQHASLDPAAEPSPPGPRLYETFLVDELPTFAGSAKSMVDLIVAEIAYPKQAADLNVEGRVVLRCHIAADGTLVKATVVKSLGYGCDEAALNALARFPSWKPATKSGKAVGVICYLPVTFSLH